jgi:pilus assembly protein Flp/PilA
MYGRTLLNNLIAKLHIAIMNLKNEEGQDLVEYALLVALIAFAATAGMNTLANSINSAFSSVAGKLTLA